MGGVGESCAAPVSCSGVDGGNSLQEDVQFKVLHRFYPVYSLIKPLRACLYGGEVTSALRWGNPSLYVIGSHFNLITFT